MTIKGGILPSDTGLLSEDSINSLRAKLLNLPEGERAGILCFLAGYLDRSDADTAQHFWKAVQRAMNLVI